MVSVARTNPPRPPVGIDIRQCEQTRWGLWQTWGLSVLRGLTPGSLQRQLSAALPPA